MLPSADDFAGFFALLSNFLLLPLEFGEVTSPVDHCNKRSGKLCVILQNCMKKQELNEANHVLVCKVVVRPITNGMNGK